MLIPGYPHWLINLVQMWWEMKVYCGNEWIPRKYLRNLLPVEGASFCTVLKLENEQRALFIFWWDVWNGQSCTLSMGNKVLRIRMSCDPPLWGRQADVIIVLKKGNWGLERSGNCPNVRQIVGGRLGPSPHLLLFPLAWARSTITGSVEGTRVWPGS